MARRHDPGKAATSGACPCASGKLYGACCGLLHAGAPASDALALMRSRYCAYVLGKADYLLATWHPETRPAQLELDAGETRWLGLEIRRHARLDADHAVVEFVARYRVHGRGHRLHETSRFTRQADGHWVYRDGDVHGAG